MKNIFEKLRSYFFGEKHQFDADASVNVLKDDNKKYRQILADLSKELQEYKRAFRALVNENHELKTKNELYRELLADEEMQGR